MRITELLVANGIQFTPKEQDNVYIECPFCGSENLSISLSSGLWHCWSAECDMKGHFGGLMTNLNLKSNGEVLFEKVQPIRDKTLTEADRAAILNAAHNKAEVLEWSASRCLDGTFVLSQGIGYDTQHHAIVFPFRNEKGTLIGAKYQRDKERWIKGEEPKLYLLDPTDLKREKLVLVEGETDALTLKQFGIPVAATLGAGKDKGYGLLASSRQLYLGFDNDVAGEAGVEKAVGSLGGYRCKRVTWGAKDPNDWVKAGATKEEIINALREAKSLAVDTNSLSAGEALDEYFQEHENGIKPRRSWGFTRLDSLTRGLGGGELVGILAESGTGKTTFILNVLRSHVLQNINCGFASLEEHPIHEITPKLYSCLLGKNINTLRLAKDDATSIKPDLGRIQLFKGSVSLDAVLNWVKECYYVHDCKMVAIDYFQLLVKDEESVQSLKEAIFALKNLTKEFHDLCILIVIQPKQKQRWRNKDGIEAKPLKLEGSDARGGAVINQTVDKMLTICGVRGHPNVTQYEYTKCRGHMFVSKRDWLSKYTQLEYDHQTLRMQELEHLIYGG